jgi:phospholipase C
MRYRFLVACAAIVAALWTISALQPASAQVIKGSKFDRVFIIMMENQGFDNIVGHNDGTSLCGPPESTGCPDTPYITFLATNFELATLYFGTTHPSLPNYISMFAGDFFGIHDDNPSCAAQPPQSPCDPVIAGPTLVDTLEAAGGSWEAFEQTMPSPGFLGPRWPLTGDTLYAQKHNPFVYFKNVVDNPIRLAKILPYNNPSDLASHFVNPDATPNVVFIVPDQCHDMHGQSGCSNNDALLREGDAHVRGLVNTITSSRAFTTKSIILVVWDENDFSSNLGCCLSVNPGGGHIAAIVIPGHLPAGPLRSPTLFNHYSFLKTMEDNWGLVRLRNSASPLISNMFDLIPSWSFSGMSARDVLRRAP